MLDNRWHGNRWAVRLGPLVEDHAGLGLLRQLFSAYAVDAMVHLAALAYVGAVDAHAPLSSFRNNIVNTLNLLDLMREPGVDHIFFSSACLAINFPIDVPSSKAILNGEQIRTESRS